MRRALLSLLLALPTQSLATEDRALGVAMAVAAGRECPGIVLDAGAVARLIQEASEADADFERRAFGGYLEGAVLRIRSASPLERREHCEKMRAVIAGAGLGH